MQPSIHSLHVYPLKSCQGISLESADLVATGINYDRHWMLVDKQGQFLSQRQLPDMARIRTELTQESLIVSTSTDNAFEIPLKSKEDRRKSVKIWNDSCHAAQVSNAASRWFRDVLQTDCELVFLPNSETRRVDPVYASEQHRVGFADGYPLLIISRATIDLLNSKLLENVSIDRFRANIILDGCEAHAEDEWSQISINGIDIRLVKACSRCVIPSIHQQTAKRHAQILKALASYRRRDGQIFVGQNALHLSCGTIHRGQVISTVKK